MKQKNVPGWARNEKLLRIPFGNPFDVNDQSAFSVFHYYKLKQ